MLNTVEDILYFYAMIICGQTFSQGSLEHIQRLVDETPDISRRALSRWVCDLLAWRHPDGRPKDMSCRKALSRLHKTGILRMPEAVQGLAFNRRTVQEPFVRSPVSCSLQELGSVTLVMVDNRLSEEAQTWKSLMKLHYLGERLFCAGLRYLVHSSAYGWLGALAFSPAAFRVSARDHFIGWNEQNRLANLDRVVGNSRFLIHPEVRVPHLASHVLGKSLRRLPHDWQSRYGKEPLMVETFVEQNRFTGIEEQGRLSEYLKGLPEAGIQEIVVPRKGNRPARTAQLSIHYNKVLLAPPTGKNDQTPLSIWAILAKEKESPEGIEPLRWMLLTTAPTDSFAEACKHLSWYTQRWTIEVFHKTLKSGCRIENRQLGNANRLEACLAIDLVVAWRIHHLTKLGRETPDVPCSVYFEEAEWRALTTFVTKKPIPDDKPPTLREAILMVAILGGFLGRKGDGVPGTQTLWLGLQRLDDITEMWKVMTAILSYPQPTSHISGVQPKYG